jgi:hypothetical protein
MRSRATPVAILLNPHVSGHSIVIHQWRNNLARVSSRMLNTDGDQVEAALPLASRALPIRGPASIRIRASHLTLKGRAAR